MGCILWKLTFHFQWLWRTLFPHTRNANVVLSLSLSISLSSETMLGTCCMRDPKKTHTVHGWRFVEQIPIESSTSHTICSATETNKVLLYSVQFLFHSSTTCVCTQHFTIHWAQPFHSIFHAKNIEHQNIKISCASFACTTWHICVWIAGKNTRKREKMNPS